MRIGPILALATLFTLPVSGCREDKTGNDFRQAEPRAGATFPVYEVPFLFPSNQQEEVSTFFHYKRDSEKDFVYLEAEASTIGIVNHLKQKHGLPMIAIVEAIETIDRLIEKFNEAASSKQQVEINVNKLDQPTDLPEDPDSMSDDAFKKLIQETPILMPTLRDFLDTPEKVLEFGLNEGQAHDLTVIDSLDLMTSHGFLKTVFLQNGMSVNEESAKLRWFIDPRTGTLDIGVYLEVAESPGRFGNGGKNGLLIVTPPAAIITSDKMYLIGLDLLDDIPKVKYDPNRKPPERGPIPMPQIPGARKPSYLEA